jgi:hypothetical protein
MSDLKQKVKAFVHSTIWFYIQLVIIVSIVCLALSILLFPIIEK